MNDEIDIRTELESNEAHPHPVDRMHQFDESGLSYNRRHRIVVWTLLLAITVSALLFFLFETNPGRELLGIETDPLDIDNNFPVSTPTSLPPAPDEEIAQQITDREFSTDNTEEVVEKLKSDIETAIDLNSSSKMFEDFTPEVELGIELENN